MPIKDQPDGSPGRCQHVKRDGQQCHAHPLDGSRFCWFHCPGRIKERARARRRGGIRRSAGIPRAVLPAGAPPVEIASVRDIRSLLVSTIDHVLHGRVGPAVANSVGYLCSGLVSAFDREEFEQRLTELEQRLGITDEENYAHPN